MGDQNLLSQAPPCFGRLVKPVSRRVDVRPVVKIIAESLSQHDEKHVVPTPLSGIRVGRRRKVLETHTFKSTIIKLAFIRCVSSSSSA
jgi:hypothetical protein